MDEPAVERVADKDRPTDEFPPIPGYGNRNPDLRDPIWDLGVETVHEMWQCMTLLDRCLR